MDYENTTHDEPGLEQITHIFAEIQLFWLFSAMPTIASTAIIATIVPPAMSPILLPLPAPPSVIVHVILILYYTCNSDCVHIMYRYIHVQILMSGRGTDTHHQR